MNEYDHASRYVARRISSVGVLHWCMTEVSCSWTAWRWQKWLDSQNIPYPGERERRVDPVAGFERKAGDGGPAAVVLEFMTRARADALKRLQEYTLVISREVPYQIDPLVSYDTIGILVNLTGSLSSGSVIMRPRDMGGLGTTTDVGVINLEQKSARTVLEGVGAGSVARAMLAWVPLMAEGDDQKVLKEWLRVASLEGNEEIRADLAGLAPLFADLAGRGDLWRTELRGWNVERSPYLMEREAKTVQSVLLELLTTKLKQEPPADVVSVIQNQMDPAILRRWCTLVFGVITSDDARTAFNLTANGAP